MNDHEKIVAAYSVVHAPPETLTEVMKMTKNIQNRKIHTFSRRTITVALAACLILALCTAAAAISGKHYNGWGGNADYVQNEEETIVTLYTEQLTEPVVFIDGRMIFTVNGEHLDITELVSEDTPFIYEYPEAEITHCILIGLNGPEPGHYGFAEYVKDENEWIGGYSARTNQEADGKGPAWLENGKNTIGVPW